MVKFWDKGKLMSNLNPLMKSIFDVIIKAGCMRCSNEGTLFGADGASNSS